MLIGVNLLREGLDLPEVSLVAILDADKEGFLRSARSLTQTAGRAARNINGLVIMYADKVTKSMQKTIDETDRRRVKQVNYNAKHGITPQGLNKSKIQILGQTKVIEDAYDIEAFEDRPNIAADPVVQYMNKEQIQKLLTETQRKMKKASKEEDFMEAARLRDEMAELSKMLN